MIDAAKNKFRAPIFPLGLRTLALTSMGLGFLRPAPGTWGSMPPVALAAFMLLFGADATAVNIALAVVLALACILCTRFGDYAEERFGRKDAGEVVIDETAGQSLALLLGLSGYVSPGPPVPQYYFVAAIATPCAVTFLLFRFFDVVKPWPSRRLESLPAGWGVLADDLMAGLYAGLATRAVLWLTISTGSIP